MASGVKQQRKQKEEKQHGLPVVCLYPEIDVRKKHCKYIGKENGKANGKGKGKGKW